MDDEEELTLDRLKELVDEPPMVRVVNLIVSQAIYEQANAVHIEPGPETARVRYRVDGVLHEVMHPPKHIIPVVIARLKIMADMDVSERRIPQDGLIRMSHDGASYDVRVSSLLARTGKKWSCNSRARTSKGWSGSTWPGWASHQKIWLASRDC